MELTRSEMEIMDVLWESGVPMSRADLLAHSEEKTWKDSSVHILLNGLLQKGAIQEAGLVKRIKTYGRVFAPTMSREEYFANTIFSHRHKPDMVGLFAALMQREEMTPEAKQKLHEDLKNWFIEKHGNRFLKMSEEKQNEMITHYIITYAEKIKLK